MESLSFILRHRNIVPLLKTIKSISDQNIDNIFIKILDYSGNETKIRSLLSSSQFMDIPYDIVQSDGCWASDLNKLISNLNTDFCILSDEGTVWSPDYLRIALLDLKRAEEEYGNLCGYVSRGSELYGHYTGNVFKTKEIRMVNPSLNEGIVNISDMIFKSQFHLSQAILKSSYIKKINFNPSLNRLSYWDFCLRLIFAGDIYATNQLHTFLYHTKSENLSWPKIGSSQSISRADEIRFHNHIFRNGGNTDVVYQRAATERSFGHVYSLIHDNREKIDRNFSLINDNRNFLDWINILCNNLAKNAFLVKSGKFFETIHRIKRKVFVR